MRRLTLGVVQSAGEPGPTHLDEVGKLACKAAQQGSELILLPELFSTPFHFTTKVWHRATPQGGAMEQFLCATARALGVYLGGSYLEARGQDFFNTFALASPQGRIVGRVGKAHPCSLERCVFAPSPGPQVIVCELGRIGADRSGDLLRQRLAGDCRSFARRTTRSLADADECTAATVFTWGQGGDCPLSA